MDTYEKKYKEALEKAKEFYKGYKQRDNQLYADDLETIFPELRGGKEERTINCIGMCLTDANEQRFKDYGTTLKDCLAWLEKQEEKHKTEPQSRWWPSEKQMQMLHSAIEVKAPGAVHDGLESLYNDLKNL